MPANHTLKQGDRPTGKYSCPACIGTRPPHPHRLSPICDLESSITYILHPDALAQLRGRMVFIK